MKEIKNVLDKINTTILNGRILSADLESILLSISGEYDSTIVGSQPGNEAFFDMAYDSTISFTNKQTNEESIYFFNMEAGKFVY
jgi:hypothetical protein